MEKLLRYCVIALVFAFLIILLQKALIAQTNPTCCRYCSTGKACGNACIPKKDSCNKPSGCACNGTRPTPQEFEGLERNDLTIKNTSELPELLNISALASQTKLKATNFKTNQLFPFKNFEGNLELAQNATPFRCSVPLTASIMQESQVTVKKRNLKITLFDSEKSDGDIVTMFVDRKVYGDITLTSPGKEYEIDLGDKHGKRQIAFKFKQDGGIRDPDRRPVVTIGIAIKETDVADSKIGILSGGNLKLVSNLRPREVGSFTVGFPLIKISISKYPQSACHIAEAWRIPPVPMEQPIPGKPANPLRASYPRVLTRATVAASKSNRSKSTRNYQCLKSQNGKKEQRDEYPPAAVVENAGSAHIKCINADDNQDSGNDFGAQLERYGSKRVKILPGDTVEWILVN